MRKHMTCLELCAGAGGQALGLEAAGFNHLALVEIDPACCATLRLNRPEWNVVEADIRTFDAKPYLGVDLVAAGLPCPPFSVAGKQLGSEDERNLFPDALRIISECKPKAVMIENVRGILDAVFFDYRNYLEGQLKDLGYRPEWRLFNASDFGVPQLRPRVAFVAVRQDLYDHFAWPMRQFKMAPTVGETLYDLMAGNGWPGAKLWKKKANQVAPTIVGGSKKHGGPDLGPTRARMAWATLGVDGIGIADAPPARDFVGMPRLTVRMVARIQGFPDDWQFSGKKTASYRQVGNAFPPPVAQAVAEQIKLTLRSRKTLSLAG
jgi:DNA (cytosine-5)-methyltransferase 1